MAGPGIGHTLRHFRARVHWPEWAEAGGLYACVRCIKRGRKVMPFNFVTVGAPA